MKSKIKKRWYDKIPKLNMGETFCMSCIQVLQIGMLQKHSKSIKHNKNVEKKLQWKKEWREVYGKKSK